jgi:hypothetical protein
MGYVGGKLEPWFSDVPVKRALYALADEGGEQMVTNVREFTPKDTGHLWESIKKMIVVVRPYRGTLAYESGAETNVEYAEYVERGTGLFGPYHRRYIIRPKDPNGWLRWIDPITGQPVFAKQVIHPGSEGAHMFARGATKTEAEFERWAQPILTRWARQQERINPYAKVT